MGAQLGMMTSPSLVVSEEGPIREIGLPALKGASVEDIERWKRISSEFLKMQEELVALAQKSGIYDELEALGFGMWAEALGGHLDAWGRRYLADRATPDGPQG